MSQYVRLAGAVRPSEKGERGKMGEEKRSLRRENVKPVLTFKGVFFLTCNVDFIHLSLLQKKIIQTIHLFKTQI